MSSKLCCWFYNKTRKINRRSLGWCGSVDWAWASEPKCHHFNSQSGHMSALRARSPVGGAREANTYWCFSSSLYSSLPLCLKIIKIFLNKQMKGKELEISVITNSNRIVWVANTKDSIDKANNLRIWYQVLKIKRIIQMKSKISKIKLISIY